MLFNSESKGIRFDEALRQGKICYFQLPTMYYPVLSAACGKLALQSFQSAVAKRHLHFLVKPKFFSVF